MKKTASLFTFLILLLFVSCEKENSFKGKKNKEETKVCLDLVYPVTYTMPDGTEVTGDTEKEVWTLIKAWYEDYPDVQAKPSLVYPVEVVLEDGSMLDVADEAEMILAKKDCDEDEMALCEWDEDTEASGPEFEKYIVEELVLSEDCGCVVSGMEKYLENGQTRFLIYYKYEGCEGYGYKVICENGDCENGEKCKFLQDCD